jgi:hypothetical protein
MTVNNTLGAAEAVSPAKALPNASERGVEGPPEVTTSRRDTAAAGTSPRIRFWWPFSDV